MAADEGAAGGSEHDIEVYSPSERERNARRVHGEAAEEGDGAEGARLRGGSVAERVRAVPHAQHAAQNLPHNTQLVRV